MPARATPSALKATSASNAAGCCVFGRALALGYDLDGDGLVDLFVRVPVTQPTPINQKNGTLRMPHSTPKWLSPDGVAAPAWEWTPATWMATDARTSWSRTSIRSTTLCT